MRDLDLEVLLVRGERAALTVKLLWQRLVLLLCECSFVERLVASLLKLVVLEVEGLLESEGLLGVAVLREGVHDLRQLSLANHCVLQLSDIIVNEDNEALVDSKLEGQEHQRNVDRLVLADLDGFKLAGEGVW